MSHEVEPGKPSAYVVLCPNRFANVYPKGHEEKCCTHGVFSARCSRCGGTRKTFERPFWHCVGWDGSADAIGR